ncbi:MFS transporter [Undibacterium sp. TS12]|uniref:MFS transporter n=1 Tax=Undibacterium sp. TS12 TaxID=2908202 RepID=UPI001F4CDDBD|nr:MFS transporter [Undibacterium sp. TS12]MCH8618693.1 MFS transporter [Undibacterium sp. TS12]
MSTTSAVASGITRQHSEKLLILGAVCLAALSMPVSFTGPAVALSAIQRELGGSPFALSWVTNAFMLSFGSALLASGSMADQYGRKRVFMMGMAIFLLTSLALVGVQSLLWFDVLRAGQGLGAAAAFSSGLAAQAQEFEDQQRTRVFSFIGTTFGVGLAFGPLLCGVLVKFGGWRAVFMAMSLMAALALLAAWLYMRDSKDPQAAAPDVGGTVSFTAALSAFTFALLLAPARGWHDLAVLGLLLTAILLLAMFVMIERRQPRPMLDLSLFRYPRFVGAQFLAAAPAYSFVVLLILLPGRFIGIENLGEIGTGWLMLALSSPMLCVPMLAAWLTRWISVGAICGTGLLIAALGLLCLSMVEPGQAPSQFIASLMIIGLGTALPWGLMDGLAVSVVPKERAGMAAGIFSTTRVAGEGIALALVSAILAGLIQQAVPVSQAVNLPEFAQRLAAGDLANAQTILPGLTRTALQLVYGNAFQILLRILASITLLTGLLTWILLGKEAESGQISGDVQI